MYAVEIDTEVVKQITALPASALTSYAELMALLEVAPWSGESYNRQRPDANMRSHPFGADAEGLAIYLISKTNVGCSCSECSGRPNPPTSKPTAAPRRSTRPASRVGSALSFRR